MQLPEIYDVVWNLKYIGNIHWELLSQPRSLLKQPQRRIAQSLDLSYFDSSSHT